MPQWKLYHIWMTKLTELRPGERVTRLRNFTWLLVGMYSAQAVHLSKVAAKMPGLSCLPSRTRRLSRLLDNPAIQTRAWYQPIARGILQRLAGGMVHLIVDGSKVGFGHQLLMVAVAYRRRTLPLAWTWVRTVRGHSKVSKQIALLSYVRGLLPPHTQVILVGDAEFGEIPLEKQLNMWRWRYALRQKGRYLVKPKGKRMAQRLDSLVSKPRQRAWLPYCRLTAKHAYHVNLLAFWHIGEKEPWLLATNLDDPQAVLRCYRRRMWIEEMFGDLKGHGVDIESTQLRHFLRLSRLTLAVVLLYFWLVTFGSQTIKSGRRRLVDRNERRDYSIFRIGWNTAERRLLNNLSLHVSFDFCL